MPAERIVERERETSGAYQDEGGQTHTKNLDVALDVTLKYSDVVVACADLSSLSSSSLHGPLFLSLSLYSSNIDRYKYKRRGYTVEGFEQSPNLGAVRWLCATNKHKTSTHPLPSLSLVLQRARTHTHKTKLTNLFFHSCISTISCIKKK